MKPDTVLTESLPSSEQIGLHPRYGKRDACLALHYNFDEVSSETHLHQVAASAR
ncbi:hypothetical protein [Enterobacter hormaechei]|uniref:hypothetical protein n=1 Tax=Enterobacter hormaechei TaxID=158836 RepID=UPI0039C64E6C